MRTSSLSLSLTSQRKLPVRPPVPNSQHAMPPLHSQQATVHPGAPATPESVLQTLF